jgi:5-formyltetrahydrofolate cyclo-ligase
LKNKIRKEVLAGRDRIPPAERSAKSRDMEARLFVLPEFCAARSVLFFASFRSEVETGPMIRRALRSGKRVLLPRVNGDSLELFEISDLDRDTAPGAWGIPEPVTAKQASVGDVDLVVVPGAAFDEQGNRVGYGAGYYDKLLAAFSKTTVALAFELQIVSLVPADGHDVPVKKIVTEKRIIDTSAK